MKRKITLNKEEVSILKSIKLGLFKSVDNLDKQKKKYSRIAYNTLKKKVF